MRISKIEHNGKVHTVTLTPNFIEKIFGLKESVQKFKETGYVFTFGNGNIYVRENGEKLCNGHWIGEALDCDLRKF
jgi:hypothetical protein